MNRRSFLKMSGLLAASVTGTASGAWWLANRGEDLPVVDPFAPEPWQAASTSGPVLLLVNEDPRQPFGRFLAEILWAEGLNAFNAARLRDADAHQLAQYACVLVSAGDCSPAQSQMLADYAAGGGGLVVFQPDGALAKALGLEAAERAADGWLRVEPRHALARGMTSQPLALHVPASLYTAGEAEAAAWLGESAGRPAVFARRRGSGWVTVWAYDLAWNVVLTRQGNPAKAQGADYQRLQRPVDLFEGWIDFERMRYPQADEQQRLLANIITWLCQAHLPLPRLWYFSGKARSLLVATSDAHRNTYAALECITQIVEQHMGNLTFYYSPPLPGDLGLLKIQVENLSASLGILPRSYFPTPEQFAGLRAHGHEITMHPYITGDYVESCRQYWKAFSRMNYGALSQTIRIHEVNWRGWSDSARIQAGFGIRLNTDYYHYGPLFQRGPGQIDYGHFTGSGLAMRFANSNGRILNIFQQVTQFSDEQFLNLPWTGPEAVGPEAGVRTITDFFKSSLKGQSAAVAINFHSDPYDMEDRYRLPAESFLKGTLAEVDALGVPIWNAQRWLDFISMRQAARIENLTAVENQLAFDLAAEKTSHPDGLSLLLPSAHHQKRLAEVRVDGQPIEIVPWALGGLDYGLVALEPGSHHIEAGYL